MRLLGTKEGYPGHAVFGRVACSTERAAKRSVRLTVLGEACRKKTIKDLIAKTGTAIDYRVGGFLEMRDTLDLRVFLDV